MYIQASLENQLAVAYSSGRILLPLITKRSNHYLSLWLDLWKLCVILNLNQVQRTINCSTDIRLDVTDKCEFQRRRALSKALSKSAQPAMFTKSFNIICVHPHKVITRTEQLIVMLPCAVASCTSLYMYTLQVYVCIHGAYVYYVCIMYVYVYVGIVLSGMLY